MNKINCTIQVLCDLSEYYFGLALFGNIFVEIIVM